MQHAIKTYPQGTRVMIQGLMGSPQFNFSTARVKQGYSSLDGRIEVQIVEGQHNGRLLKCQPKNLILKK